MTKSTDTPVVNTFQNDLTGHIFGIVDNPGVDLPAITSDLFAAGLPFDGVHTYCCARGADDFDAHGADRGVMARISRVMQNLIYDDQLAVIERNLAAGHAVIGVDVDDDNADLIADIFREHGGHDIVHYGRLSWVRMSAAKRTVPETSDRT